MVLQIQLQIFLSHSFQLLSLMPKSSVGDLMLRESLNAMLQSSSHWPDQCQAVLCMCCAALCTRVVSMSVPCYACALILPTPLIEYTSTSTVSASLPALFLNVASVFCSFGITLGSISIQWTGAPHSPFSAH